MTEKNNTSLIYVVDDDANVRKLVAIALKENGFEVNEFSDGVELLTKTRKKMPDLIILDWIMPELDGLAVCGRLKLEKETKKIPVMMLTAKTEEVDCILCLEMGADDYLKKPFSVKELVTRVRAMIRRKSYSSQTEVKNEILVIGDLKINLSNRTITKNGKFLNLTMKEFDMLVSLVNERSKVVTREQLMSRVWSVDFSGDARTVDVHIRYLRQKIEDIPEAPVYVKTVRG
ncbi:MAG: response regulator transcription factor, partial [Firmicutes bacterium]|nr:response regulator transcription factor [Bacillota bacterium]